MRRAVSASLVLVALCGCSARTRGGELPPVAGNGAPAAGAVPAWVPPYTPAQQALIQPVDSTVTVPAARVFPDLERFGYANNKRLDSVADAAKFTAMTAKVVEDSPRLYQIQAATPDAANFVGQYGPAPSEDDDPWSVVARGPEGIGKLEKAPLPPAAKQAYDKGVAALGAHDASAAVAALRDATAKQPKAPAAVWLALADALDQAGDAGGAKKALEDGIAADATSGALHRALAERMAKAGDAEAAKREVAEAIAYWPASKRSLALGDQLSFGAVTNGDGRVAPFACFLDVDAVGAIHVASEQSGPAQIYASCRAIFRYEPEVRAAIFSQPAETPYYLSVVEEVVCYEAAIGAWAFDQSKGQEVQEKPGGAELLLKIAQEEGLSGYVMVEVLGPRRPERARAAPPDVHAAMVQYVERHVLGGAVDSAPAGTYTAAR